MLDEPTNHLDIPSKEMLEEALQRFDGSVIAVSHDRYFLRRIATRVVTVRPRPCHCQPGLCPASSVFERLLVAQPRPSKTTCQTGRVYGIAASITVTLGPVQDLSFCPGYRPSFSNPQDVRPVLACLRHKYP